MEEMILTDELLSQAARYVRPIVTRVLQQFPDSVDDVIQNTVLKIHRGFKTFEGRSAFMSWCAAIALNESRMFLRANKHQFVSIDQEDPDTELSIQIEDPQPSHERVLILRDLAEKLVQGLSVKRRTILDQYLIGYKMREIAEIHQVGLSTAKSEIFRMRHMLRERFAELAE